MSRNNNYEPTSVSELADAVDGVTPRSRPDNFAILALHPGFVDDEGLTRRTDELLKFAEHEFEWPEPRLQIARELYRSTQKLDIQRQELNFKNASSHTVEREMIEPVMDVLIGNTTPGVIMDVRSHLELRAMPLGHHTYFPRQSDEPPARSDWDWGLHELEESVASAARERKAISLDPDADGNETVRVWYPNIARRLGHFSTAAFAMTAYSERLPDGCVIARRDIGLLLPTEKTVQAAEHFHGDRDIARPLPPLTVGRIARLLENDTRAQPIEMKTNFTIIDPKRPMSPAEKRHWDDRNELFS